jgi:hypothetical protein
MPLLFLVLQKPSHVENIRSKMNESEIATICARGPPTKFAEPLPMGADNQLLEAYLGVLSTTTIEELKALAA